jgi:CheY-like chemotaxis protein
MHEAGRSVRVLYVEDNALVRELTCELLATAGREVIACATAEEALGEFAACACDVVITDMNLPAAAAGGARTQCQGADQTHRIRSDRRLDRGARAVVPHAIGARAYVSDG